MAQAAQSNKTPATKGKGPTQKLTELIQRLPGIRTSELRSRAEELGMRADAISGALYTMEKRGKIYYGEEGPGQNRTCFVGSKPAAAEAEPVAAATQNAQSAPVKPKKVTKPKTVEAKPVTAVAPVSTTMALTGELGQAISALAGQLASAVAQQIVAQIRPQLAQKVSQAVSRELASMGDSIQVPGVNPAIEMPAPAPAPSAQAKPAAEKQAAPAKRAAKAPRKSKRRPAPAQAGRKAPTAPSPAEQAPAATNGQAA